MNLKYNNNSNYFRYRQFKFHTNILFGFGKCCTLGALTFSHNLFCYLTKFFLEDYITYTITAHQFVKYFSTKISFYVQSMHDLFEYQNNFYTNTITHHCVNTIVCMQLKSFTNTLITNFNLKLGTWPPYVKPVCVCNCVEHGTSPIHNIILYVMSIRCHEKF